MGTQSLEKSQRINLGSGDISMSEKSLRRLSYLACILFLIPSIYYVTKDDVRTFEVVMSAIYLLNAGLFFFRAHFELSTTSKYAPHFLVSQNDLKIKTSVYKNSKYIDWDDVKKIELGYYKIGIQDKTGLQYYPYKTRKETSIKLKRTIEEIATQKGIEVENLLKR